MPHFKRARAPSLYNDYIESLLPTYFDIMHEDRQAFISFCSLASQGICRDEIINSKGVTAILDGMGRFPTDRKLQIAACGALSKLVCMSDKRVNQQHPVCIGSVIVAMALNPMDATLQKQGSCFLSKLATENSACLSKIVNLGGLTGILEALRDHKADCQLVSAICKALQVFVESNIGRQSLVAGGIVELLLDIMMQHPKSIKVQHACSLILNTLAGDVDTGKTIVALGGVEILLGTMKALRHVGAVQEAGCCVLWPLVQLDEGRTAFMVVGGLHIVIEAMFTHSTVLGLQRCCCALLWQLSKTPSVQKELANGRCRRAVNQAMKLHKKDAQLMHYGQHALQRMTLKKKTKFANWVDSLKLPRAACEASKKATSEIKSFWAPMLMFLPCWS